MNNELPIKAQILIYKIVDSQLLILCLKRSKIDGGFWHVLTGTMENNENLNDCIYREIREEINVNKIINLSKELKRYVWTKNDLPIWVIEFAAEISNTETILLNEENDDFKWLNYVEAKNLLEKDSAKELVDLFVDYNKNYIRNIYTKTNLNYLENISSNLEEKINFIINSAKDNKLPLVKNKIKLLEVGLGSGNVILELKNKIGNKIDITAIDIYPDLVDIGNKIGIDSHLANVCKLPFEDNSFSCVNASSILHEVSSYGFFKKESIIYGVDAVKMALEEINRVLCINGIFFYRDVLMPEKNEVKEVLYKPLLWRFFIDNFLENFVISGPSFYKDNYFISKNDDDYTISGKCSFHREIQKHYLLWILNIKKIFKVEFNLSDLKDDLTKENLFIENYFLMNFKKNTQLIKNIKENLYEWLKREGGEHYIYLSSREMVELCSQINSEDNTILVAKNNSDIINIIRDRENEYLQTVISNPEIEGKQIINFTKIYKS